jgi:hypothetical protein
MLIPVKGLKVWKKEFPQRQSGRKGEMEEGRLKLGVTRCPGVLVAKRAIFVFIYLIQKIYGIAVWHNWNNKCW